MRLTVLAELSVAIVPLHFQASTHLKSLTCDGVYERRHHNDRDGVRRGSHKVMHKKPVHHAS